MAPKTKPNPPPRARAGRSGSGKAMVVDFSGAGLKLIKPDGFCLLPLVCWWLVLMMCSVVRADAPAMLVQDREVIERVYYKHRLGQKPPFEATLPAAALENLIRLNLSKETALRKAYGVVITAALLDAEVERINATTRAPGMLTEIKAALGNDPVRFANSFAKPILIERLLRDRFENDDALHRPRRREAEQVREQLLQTRAQRHEPVSGGPDAGDRESQCAPIRPGDCAPSDLAAKLFAVKGRYNTGVVVEITWQMTGRPPEIGAHHADELEIKKRYGPQAQLLSPPATDQAGERMSCFEDLPEALQNHLRSQLRAPGDVSAVIETPTGFLLYVARERTAKILAVVCLSLPKRDYEQWLREQE